MRIVENVTPGMPTPRQMTRGQRLRSRIALVWHRHVSRKLPRLVWPGDEIDVRITFTTYGLYAEDATAVFEAQKALRGAGISFDSGSGVEGRDWELDWSLTGPMRVKFVRRSQKPEARVARPKPDLKVVA